MIYKNKKSYEHKHGRQNKSKNSFSKNKFNKLIFLISFTLILIFLFLLPKVNAVSTGTSTDNCISLKTAKLVYLPKETVQVEMDANTTRDILSSDIFLYRDNSRLPLDIFISKITKTKYFIWFDLPSKPGSYNLEVRGLCRNQFYIAKTEIKVKKTITSKYESLRLRVLGALSQYNNKWSSLSLEQHILSAGALSYLPLSKEALEDYMKRSDSCLNKQCNTKFNALTLIAFKDNLVREKMQNYLKDYQNYIDYENYGNGNRKWLLKINSSFDSSKKCNLSIKDLSNAKNNTKNFIIELSPGLNIFNLNNYFSNVSDLNSFNKIQISVDCKNASEKSSGNISGKIIFFDNINNLSKEFISEFENNKSTFSIDNSGCWGDNLKTNCDIKATSYALLSLAIAGRLNMSNCINSNNSSNSIDNCNYEDVKAINWLKENSKAGNGIEEKAVAFYLTKDSEILNKILNSQSLDGWWSKTINSYQPDIRTTSIVLFALKNYKNYNSYNNPDVSSLNSSLENRIKESIRKSENWLYNARGLSLSDESFILLFAFQPKGIEPILAFWPGLIKTKSRGSFDLILSNKGTTNIELNATLFNSTKIITLIPNSVKDIQFDIPIVTTTDGRTISENLNLFYKSFSKNSFSDYKFSDYKNNPHIYSYSVPLLIFTEKSNEEGINGTINSSEQGVNETEQQDIINKTQGEWSKKTTELNETLLKGFRFSKSKLKINASVGKKKIIEIHLINLLDKTVRDITIDRSADLAGTLIVNPYYIDNIESKGEKKISLIIEHPNKGNYSGEITAKAKYEGQELKINIPVTIEISPAISEEKNCSELGGKICGENEFCENELVEAKNTLSCCIPSESCKKKKAKGKNIGIIIVLAIIIILIIILLLLRRKPEKEMKKFLKETSEQYEKKFQRPPSIRR